MKKLLLILGLGLSFSTNLKAQLIINLSDDKKTEEPIDVDIIPEVIIKNMLPDETGRS